MESGDVDSVSKYDSKSKESDVAESQIRVPLSNLLRLFQVGADNIVFGNL